MIKYQNQIQVQLTKLTQVQLVVLTKRYALDAIELISSYVSSYIIM
jgi:hypothetical protein